MLDLKMTRWTFASIADPVEKLKRKKEFIDFLKKLGVGISIEHDYHKTSDHYYLEKNDYFFISKFNNLYAPNPQSRYIGNKKYRKMEYLGDNTVKIYQSNKLYSIAVVRNDCLEISRDHSSKGIKPDPKLVAMAIESATNGLKNAGIKIQTPKRIIVDEFSPFAMAKSLLDSLPKRKPLMTIPTAKKTRHVGIMDLCVSPREKRMFHNYFHDEQGDVVTIKFPDVGAFRGPMTHFGTESIKEAKEAIVKANEFVQTAIDEMLKEKEGLSKKNVALLDRNRELSEQLKSVNNAMFETNIDNNSLESKNKELERRNSVLLKTNGELNSRLRDIQGAFCGTGYETVKRLEARFQSVDSKRIELSSLVKRLKDDKVSLYKKIRELEGEIKYFKSTTFAAVIDKNKSLESRNKELESAVVLFNEKRQENQKLKREMGNLNKVIMEKNDAIKGAEARNASTLNLLTQIQEKRDAVVGEKKVVEEMLENSVARTARIRVALNDVKAKYKASIKHLTEIKNELEALRGSDDSNNT